MASFRILFLLFSFFILSFSQITSAGNVITHHLQPRALSTSVTTFISPSLQKRVVTTFCDGIARNCKIERFRPLLGVSLTGEHQSFVYSLRHATQATMATSAAAPRHQAVWRGHASTSLQAFPLPAIISPGAACIVRMLRVLTVVPSPMCSPHSMSPPVGPTLRTQL